MSPYKHNPARQHHVRAHPYALSVTQPRQIGVRRQRETPLGTLVSLTKAIGTEHWITPRQGGALFSGVSRRTMLEACRSMRGIDDDWQWRNRRFSDSEADCLELFWVRL